MGIYLVMINNLKRNLNHKLHFAFMFILPVILCLTAGLVYQLKKPSIRVGVISQNHIEKDSIREILKIDDFEHRITSKENAKSDLITGQYQIIFDYTQVKEGKNPKVYSIKSLDKLLKGLKTVTYTELAAGYLMSLLLILTVMQGSVIIRDKSSGVMERYCYSIQRKRSYYGGFFLYSLVCTFLQGVIALIFMNFLVGQELTVVKCIYIAVFISLISTSSASLICIFSQTEMNANITASSITVIFTLLGGIFTPIERMPNFLKILSVFSPVRWIIEFIQWI